MENDKLLKQVDLFSGLSDKYITELAKICTKRSFKKDEFLVEQGEQGVGLFVIASGKVKIVKKPSSGEEFDLAVHGPGEFIGEMAVLDGAPRSASVVALEDTDCLLLTSWDFRARMKAHPEIALELLPVIVTRFRETNEKLLELGRA